LVIQRFAPKREPRLVVSLNLHRRHLTTSQRAGVALDMLPMLEAEAKERQRAAGGDHGNQHTGGKLAVSPKTVKAAEPLHAVEEAAKIVGVGKTVVQDIKRIAKEAPEKVQEIRAGRLMKSNFRR